LQYTTILCYNNCSYKTANKLIIMEEWFMLFFILSIASVLGLIILSGLKTNDNAINEFCKLECRKDVVSNHKFCC
jgi:hypothetical protein